MEKKAQSPARAGTGSQWLEESPKSNWKRYSLSSPFDLQICASHKVLMIGFCSQKTHFMHLLALEDVFILVEMIRIFSLI